MTMKFRTVKSSLVNLLEAEAAGRFRTFASQTQGKSAADFSGTNRTVRVFYSNGDFDKNRSVRGPYGHDLTFDLEFIVAENALVDLTVLNDPNATPAQKMSALAAKANASDLADDSWDEFADIIFQIIMDARNIDLGLADYTVSSRWVTNIQKNDIEPVGEYVVLTGKMVLTAHVEEIVSGETPVAGDKIVGTVTIKDDPNTNNTGVENDLS